MYLHVDFSFIAHHCSVFYCSCALRSLPMMCHTLPLLPTIALLFIAAVPWVVCLWCAILYLYCILLPYCWPMMCNTLPFAYCCPVVYCSCALRSLPMMCYTVPLLLIVALLFIAAVPWGVCLWCVILYLYCLWDLGTLVCPWARQFITYCLSLPSWKMGTSHYVMQCLELAHFMLPAALEYPSGD